MKGNPASFTELVLLRKHIWKVTKQDQVAGNFRKLMNSCTERMRLRKVAKTNGLFIMKMYTKEDIPVPLHVNLRMGRVQQIENVPVQIFELTATNREKDRFIKSPY